MTFDELQTANKTLSTMPIKGKAYVLVNERVKAFRLLFPEGTITTEILSLADGVVTMKASVLDESGRLLASGLAYEKETSSYINKTSFIENCETSAVGRALGFLGIGVDTAIASYEEVQNAVNNQEKKRDITAPYKGDALTPDELENLKREVGRLNINFAELLAQYGVSNEAELTPEAYMHIMGRLDAHTRKAK